MKRVNAQLELRRTFYERQATINSEIFFGVAEKNRTDTDEPSETDAAGDTNLEVRILFSKLLFPKIRVIGAEIQQSTMVAISMKVTSRIVRKNVTDHSDDPTITTIVHIILKA